ncbi:unnamed protein product [Durusdinium trenchii]|uniref:RING-type domain-containing protein n=1 Tax=Durusdinium trenchii TaxID=1381693 RepID=A0ABP0QTU4_9DINO
MARCTKWDFLEDDPDLDEEGQAAFAEASELREQANALAHHARSKELPARQELLREAVTMYGRADALLKPRVSTALEKAAVPAALAARELALQCRLNAACLALEAATVPSTGSSGLKNAEQAEEASRRLALEALQLDATNPHAALLLARWGALLEKREASEVAQWLSKAKRWAQERKDQEALAQAEALDSQLHPPPSSWGKEASDWLRMGVHLLKQGKAPEAKKLFMQTVDYLDQQGLMESFAATEQFADAVRCGQRATSLLNSTRPGMQVPFAEPELSRREGLLHLSIGHAAEANGEKDALRHFRLAAQALQRSGSDAASEGVAVLELGKRLVKESKADPEALDLAVPVLEHAISCLKRAQGRIGEEKGTKPTEEVCQRLRFRELQAQAALCEAYQIRGDRPDAEEVIEASKYLLPKAGGLALDWAELCGKWAFHAAKAGKLDEAEEALRLKWNLSGGKDTPENAALEIEDKAPCPFQQRCIQLQQEALQSLALVQQKAQNPVGVQESLGLLSQTGAQEGEMERHLQRLAPAPGASKEASCCQKYMKHFALHKGARLWLACLAAVAAVLLQKTMSGHPSEQLLNQSAGRRLAVTAALSSLAVPAVAQEGVPAKVGGRASKWFGSYDDPKHPACERNVVIAFDGTKGKIDGYDKSGAGDEGQFNCRKRRDVTYYDWSLKVKLANKDANEIVVEETGRDVVDRKRINEARETVGKWDKDGILWPDGTKWVQRKWERGPLGMALAFASLHHWPDIKTIKELVKRSIEKQIDLVDVADCPSPERTCAICLEELQGNEHVRQLPCQHCYHEECLVTWGASGYFGVSNTARLACPLCRKDHTIDVEV